MQSQWGGYGAQGYSAQQAQQQPQSGYSAQQTPVRRHPATVLRLDLNVAADARKVKAAGTAVQLWDHWSAAAATGLSP